MMDGQVLTTCGERSAVLDSMDLKVSAFVTYPPDSSVSTATN